MRWVILEWCWQPATKLPTQDGILTLFMSTKCHQFPLDQIISGHRCVSRGRRGRKWRKGRLYMPSPHQPFHRSPGSVSSSHQWVEDRCTCFCFKFYYKFQNRLLDRGCRVCSKPKGTLCNVKSLESELIFLLKSSVSHAPFWSQLSEGN